jgi:hypothetical protein
VTRDGSADAVADAEDEDGAVDGGEGADEIGHFHLDRAAAEASLLAGTSESARVGRQSGPT